MVFVGFHECFVGFREFVVISRGFFMSFRVFRWTSVFFCGCFVFIL